MARPAETLNRLRFHSAHTQTLLARITTPAACTEGTTGISIFNMANIRESAKERDRETESERQRIRAEREKRRTEKCIG